MYQRRDIPRYRRPGSRVILYDQDELEAWLKQGRTDGIDESAIEQSTVTTVHQAAKGDVGLMDISPQPVYHRNDRYR